jgi:hypothetical protein
MRNVLEDDDRGKNVRPDDGHKFHKFNDDDGHKHDADDDGTKAVAI